MRTVEEVRNRLFDIINAPNVDEKGFDAILRQFGQEVREKCAKKADPYYFAQGVAKQIRSIEIL